MKEEYAPAADPPATVCRDFLRAYVKPSEIQHDIISELSQKRSVIIHNLAEPGIKAVYSVGIIPQLTNCCLIITSLSFSEGVTRNVMKYLCDHYNKEINYCPLIKNLQLTGVDVAIGVPDDACSLLEQRADLNIKTVVFDWGNTFFDKEDEREMSACITSVLEKVEEEVQVVVCVEQKLREKYLESLKERLKGPKVFSSIDFPAKSPNLPSNIDKHEYLFVETCYNKIEKICELVRTKKRSWTNTIIFVGTGTFLKALIKKLQENNIPFSTTYELGYMRWSQMVKLANEFLEDTHFLVTPLISVSNMNSFISEKVDSIIQCDVWRHPRGYVQRLHGYENVHTVVSILARKDVNNLVKIQKCFNIHFERYYDSDKVRSTQKPNTALKHIVCNPSELQFFLRRLVEKAEISVIFVKDVSSEVAREMIQRLEKGGLNVVTHEKLNVVTHEKLHIDKQKRSNGPFVYVIDALRYDYYCFSREKLKGHMVIYYDDMPSDVNKYMERVRLCENYGGWVVINPISDVDWICLLDWQTEIGVHFEPFFLPHVMSYLDKACNRTLKLILPIMNFYTRVVVPQRKNILS